MTWILFWICGGDQLADAVKMRWFTLESMANFLFQKFVSN